MTFLELPQHKCGLYLSHNEHRNSYENVMEFTDRMGEGAWKDSDSKQRSIDTNEIWSLQWYPHNPLAFYLVFAPTLDEVIEFAKERSETGLI